MVVEILQASLLSPNKENGMRSTSNILQMKRMKKKSWQVGTELPSLITDVRTCAS